MIDGTSHRPPGVGGSAPTNGAADLPAGLATSTSAPRRPGWRCGAANDAVAVGAERRATRRALRDWKRLCRDGVLPTLTDLAPHHSPLEWSDRFLLACDPSPQRSVFVLCGARVEAAFGLRLIGQAICDVAPQHVAILQACADVARTLRPVEIEDGYAAGDGRAVLYRAVIMPIRGADHEHGYLMGVYGSCDATP